MSSTTLTIRLPAKVKIVEGVKRGLEDMKAGRVVPHDEAMRRLRATVGRAAKRKK